MIQNMRNMPLLLHGTSSFKRAHWEHWSMREIHSSNFGSALELGKSTAHAGTCKLASSSDINKLITVRVWHSAVASTHSHGIQKPHLCPSGGKQPSQSLIWSFLKWSPLLKENTINTYKSSQQKYMMLNSKANRVDRWEGKDLLTWPA